MKRVLPLLIVLMLIISSTVVVFGQSNDFESSWAREEIKYLREKEVILGYPDGTFKPERNMLKSEFYSIINHLMGFNGKADVEFIDVDANDWYYTDVQKGLKAKYILEDTILNANVNISRGEVARILSIIFNVEDDEEAATEFVDSDSFSEELIGVIGGFKKNGFINGFPDKTFRPESDITRAEVVKMLHDTSGNIVNKNETISGIIDTNVLVNAKDVVFKDTIIKGDLYLTEGIGEGDINLDGVVVEGMIYVNGGSSVSIKDSTINKMLLSKSETSVKVSFENTKVEEVRATNKSEIELINGSEISLVELDGESKVFIEKGTTIYKLNVFSKNIDIKLEGTIQLIRANEKITVNGKTINADTEINLEDGTIKDDIGASEDRNDYDEYIPPAPRPVTIKSIANIDSIIVDFATAKESIELPSKISLILSNNTNREVNVTWNSSLYNGNIAGTYIFKGNYNLPKGVTGVKPEVKITVIVKEKIVKPEEPVVLTSIEITNPADKLVYEVDEELDITGLEVTGVYSDGSEKVEKVTIDNITGFDSSEAIARQELTITIDGKTVTYTIGIKAKEEPEEPKDPVYEFTAELNKIEYAINENIILAGTVLKDNTGLESVDITFKVEDSEGNLVTLDQFNSDSDGKFEYEFIVPEEILAGEYKLTLNASEPVGKTLELNLLIKEIEAPVVLTSIEITNSADKLVYEIGEELDITGLEVTGVYSNGSEKVEEVTIEDITGFDSSEAVASQELTVTIDGKTVTYTIEIKAKEEPVEEIYIRFGIGTSAEESIIEDNILEEVTIIKGEYFPKGNPNIWVVTEGLEDDEIESIVITSSDENTIKITQRPAQGTIDPNRKRCFVSNRNELGEAKIIATVTTKDGQVYIGELDVTVVLEEAPVTLASIEITKPADKLVYEIGEELDITGLEVTGVYSDGSEKVEEVTIDNITGFDSSEAVASQELTITIDGKTVTYTIEIKDKEEPVVLTSIKITKSADKVVYEIGEQLDITGLEVTGVYSDSSEKVEEVTIEDISGFDSSEAVASQELTITIDGKTVTYTIEIKAKEESVEEISITFDYYEEDWMPGYTFIEVIEIVNAPEDAKYYKVVIGDKESSVGSTYSDAFLDMTVGEFESLLKTIGGKIELFTDAMATDKVAEVRISLEEPVEEISITLEYFDGQEAYVTSYPSTCFDVTNLLNLPENAEFYKVVLGDEISTTGKVKGYNAILSISVEEFEAQLRVSEYITVELFKDNIAEEKVGEVQVVPIFVYVGW